MTLSALTLWACLHGIATATAERPTLDWPSDATMIEDLLSGVLELTRTVSR